MTAYEIASQEENVTPWDALLKSVRRRAARVTLVDSFLEAAWAQHRADCAAHDGEPGWNPDVPGAEVRRWLTESRNEERLLARTSKMAIDAGVAKMLVERDRLEGRLLADALVAGLDILNLTAEQRMQALGAAQRALTAIADNGQDAADNHTIIPGVTTDDDPDKDDA